MTENLTQERSLEQIDDLHSKTPFRYNGNVLGMLSESMVPRFLGALTDTEKLPKKKFALSELTAIQNRVQTSKVKAIAEHLKKPELAPAIKMFSAEVLKAASFPLVVKLNDRLYIADGHHRATALWLNGTDEMEAHFKDLDEMTNAVKSESEDMIEIIKIDEEQRVVYGWASVITEKNAPVIDTQGDIIEPDELVKATTEYMKGARIAKENHRGGQIGEVLHSFPMTFEIAKSLGINTNGREGWLTGMHIKSDDVWNKIKSKQLKAFSIGARAVRVVV